MEVDPRKYRKNRDPRRYDKRAHRREYDDFPRINERMYESNCKFYFKFF